MLFVVQENKTDGFVDVVTDGPFNLDDHQLMLAALQQTDFFRSGRNVLFDHSNSPVRGLSNSDIRTLANRTETIPFSHQHVKCAVVVSQGTIEFGIARMWQGLADHATAAHLQVFASREAALNWLNENQPT